MADSCNVHEVAPCASCRWQVEGNSAAKGGQECTTACKQAFEFRKLNLTCVHTTLCMCCCDMCGHLFGVHRRWTLCASDRCFKYKALAPLFTAAKVLPVTRGGGLRQPGMTAAEARLAAGDWVHIFPEGTRNRAPDKMLPIRKGVGRLVAAAAASGELPPLVVPFVHVGMEGVMPVGSVLPATSGKVRGGCGSFELAFLWCCMLVCEFA